MTYILSAILSVIFSGIHSGVLSDILSGVPARACPAAKLAIWLTTIETHRHDKLQEEHEHTRSKEE